MLTVEYCRPNTLRKMNHETAVPSKLVVSSTDLLLQVSRLTQYLLSEL